MFIIIKIKEIYIINKAATQSVSIITNDSTTPPIQILVNTSHSLDRSQPITRPTSKPVKVAVLEARDEIHQESQLLWRCCGRGHYLQSALPRHLVVRTHHIERRHHCRHRHTSNMTRQNYGNTDTSVSLNFFMLFPLLCAKDRCHTPPCSTVVHFISRQSLLFDVILHFVQQPSLRLSSLPSPL